MEKNAKSEWTRFLLPSIIWVLFSLSGVLPAQEPPAQPASERELETQALKARCLELQASLLRTEKELETARADLAQAFLEVKQLRGEVADLRLKAANVLANQDELHDADALRLLLKDWQELHAAQQDVYREALGFGRYLDSVLDVLNPGGSQELRKALDGRFYLLLKKLQTAERLSALPAPAAAAPQTGRVLAVNVGLGVVVVDFGRDQGAGLGSLWQVEDQRVRLRLVEVRPAVSAAVAVAGKLDQLAPGAKVTAVPATAPAAPWPGRPDP
jgi:hypothetical protein